VLRYCATCRRAPFERLTADALGAMRPPAGDFGIWTTNTGKSLREREQEAHTRALDEEIEKKEIPLVGVEWRGEAEVKVRGKLTLLMKMQAV